MVYRKLLSVVALVLAITVFLGSAVFADTVVVSKEKIELMKAAGEIPPQQPTEENVAIKKDKAIEIAKTMLEDASLFEIGGVFLNPRWGTKGSVWSVEFYRKQSPGGNANVGIDANTGEIVNFNIWEGYDGQRNFIAKITRSEARELAEKFLKEKLNFDISSFELQKESPYYYGYRMGGVKEQVMYNFNYIRKFNGVLFNNFNLSIGVDGTDGKIRNYYYNKIDLDEAKLPSTEGVLTSEEAIKKYMDSVNISLQYIISFEEKYYAPSKQKIILAYVPSTYINMVDARTGKAVNYDGTEMDMTKPEIKELVDNPVPMDPGAKLGSKEITEEEAKAIAEKYKVLAEELLGVKFDNNNQNYYKPYYPGYEGDMWSYNWYTNANNMNADFNITINAKTGHITNMGLGKYDYTYEMDMKMGQGPAAVNEKVSWEKGREMALELVKKLAPEQYGFFADQNVEKPAFNEETLKYMREYGYAFTRVVNGLKFRDNNMNVSIDRETGALRNFYFNWTDLEFPAITGIVSKEDASVKFFEGTEAKLSYFVGYKYDQASGQEKSDEVPKLVYTFNSKGYMYGSTIIDATTGKLVDWGGREIKLESIQDDLQLPEHWAKRSTELLIAQGIIKDPYVEYSAELTRAEAVKMMSLAKGMIYYYDGNLNSGQSFTDVTKDSDYYLFIENALRHKILIEKGGAFKGDEKITKEEFAKLLVNMMGFGDIAKHSQIFTISGVNNVGTDNTGYVAICSVLDVLPVKPGEAFDGSARINYAEAAVALYKALEFIK